MEYSLLVVDDEQDALDSFRRGLITSGIKNLCLERDPCRAAALIAGGRVFDCALIDITMPGMDGVELLEAIKKTSPRTECIMVSALDEARTAVDCLKKGAYDYLVKPISREDLVRVVNRALERKRLWDLVDLAKTAKTPALKNKKAFAKIITASASMLRILVEAELHAASDVPVLVTGESGTGKELLAQAIHQASPRAAKAIAAINMASLSGTLFDSEFFGYVKGAFTGADKDRAGYLEHADKGSLFLDEIGNLPLELQGKLLRVLQEKEYLRLGSNIPRTADVRFIAATNEDLEALVSKGAFRKDLYYRLRGAWLHLPPLKERKDDIPLLARRFLADMQKGGAETELSQEALEMLMEYDYPGNIRELKSMLSAAGNLAGGGPILPAHLPGYLAKKKPRTQSPKGAEPTQVRTLAEVEQEHILAVYAQTGQNKSQTAKLLGIGLNTLRRKLEQYQKKS
jgi:DNA-binding NtrC family response regulator